MNQRIRRALISVFDKQGVAEFARDLAALDVQILSSGGTARLLREAGVEVTAVSDHTGFPEILDGRVKTLHPTIHGGILAVRDNEGHRNDLESAGIEPIDLVVVNLYPFAKTAATAGIARADVIEMIDIGGPAMVRAAAKNFRDVGVVVDPTDYGTVLEELREGGLLSDETRRMLSVKAFRVTSAYDDEISTYLAGLGSEDEEPDVDPALPPRLHIDFVKSQDLRYGENPHQKAAFYRDPLCSGTSVCAARQLQGKELSYNNILDLDAALALATELTERACVIIKHGNPCGTAVGGDAGTAYTRALACDPMSAFGGVIAFNRPVDGLAATEMAEHFFEAIVAPSFDDEAREVLKRKKKLRLLEIGDLSDMRHDGLDLRRVRGGMLAQTWDRIGYDVFEARVVTRRTPTEQEWKALRFAWTVAKNVKSNAIVYAQANRTLGIGAGQMSRVDSARVAAMKAQESKNSLAGAVCASDAFFPFRDGLDMAAEAGIAAVIQPGGSIRDDEVIASADEHGIAMVFTAHRHFRH